MGSQKDPNEREPVEDLTDDEVEAEFREIIKQMNAHDRSRPWVQRLSLPDDIQ